MDLTDWDGARASPSGRRDSNPRPSPWQGDALPTEPRPHVCLSSSLRTPSRFAPEDSIGSCDSVQILVSACQLFEPAPRSGALRTLAEGFLDVQIESHIGVIHPCSPCRNHALGPLPWPLPPSFELMSPARGSLVEGRSCGRFVLSPGMALVFLNARAIGAVVARFVHTEEVTGSNPVSPTPVK